MTATESEVEELRNVIARAIDQGAYLRGIALAILAAGYRKPPDIMAEIRKEISPEFAAEMGRLLKGGKHE